MAQLATMSTELVMQLCVPVTAWIVFFSIFCAFALKITYALVRGPRFGWGPGRALGAAGSVSPSAVFADVLSGHICTQPPYMDASRIARRICNGCVKKSAAPLYPAFNAQLL